MERMDGQAATMLDRLNSALAYLEEHLGGEIDPARAAQLAGFPLYYFNRMFSHLCDIPLSEYVRRRRLSLAAGELAATGAKVIDVALKYGYTSPTAFNRAFRAMHGITPSEAKRPGAKLTAYPPIRFQIQIKGAIEMEYRIEQHPAFTVAGIKKHFCTEFEENMKGIPLMWQELDEATCQTIVAANDTEPKGLLGVCAMVAEKEMDYYIAAATSAPAEKLDTLQVPAATWAIFPSVGPMPEAIQAVWKRIYGEWFPSSGFDHADWSVPELEVYTEGDNKSADYYCEVWIPVVKK